jgi:RimJ/RimL family protein N-acetyltransferase
MSFPSLRPWKKSDLPDLIRYANNPNIAANLVDQFPHPYTESDARVFISRTLEQHHVQMLAITLEEKAIGGIGLHPMADIFRMNAELGYWLAEPFWGQGIMTEAIRLMVAHGFAHKPDIQRIFARPFGSNFASQRALEKAGFELEARFSQTLIKNGTIEDELVYAIRSGGCGAGRGGSG